MSLSSNDSIPTSIGHLPVELVEKILCLAELKDVANMSQTCRAYHQLIYRTEDKHIWRTLFLQYGFDDPRLVLGQDSQISWDTSLQRYSAITTRLRSFLAQPLTFSDLKTIFELVENSRPSPKPMDFDSFNLQHLHHLLWSGTFPHIADPTVGPDDFHSNLEEVNMLSRLKVYAGLDAVSSSPARRLRARCFVYDLRNYHDGCYYGPFIPDGSGRVNWKHLYAVLEVIVMNILDLVDIPRPGLPVNMKYIQAQSIPRYPNADPRDWAGVVGRWQVTFCFCDHRDLLAYNRLNVFRDIPDPSIFEEEGFEEAIRFLEFELELERVEDPPPGSLSSRPTLYFAGRVSGNSRVKGRVYMTADNQVRWSFVSGQQGQTIWSTEAVQIGGVASAFGALGCWTTIFHDLDDPVGPMWLWKLPVDHGSGDLQ